MAVFTKNNNLYLLLHKNINAKIYKYNNECWDNRPPPRIRQHFTSVRRSQRGSSLTQDFIRLVLANRGNIRIVWRLWPLVGCVFIAVGVVSPRRSNGAGSVRITREATLLVSNIRGTGERRRSQDYVTLSLLHLKRNVANVTINAIGVEAHSTDKV